MKRPEWKPLPDEPVRTTRGETYNEYCARTGGRSYELARSVLSAPAEVPEQP